MSSKGLASSITGLGSVASTNKILPLDPGVVWVDLFYLDIMGNVIYRCARCWLGERRSVSRLRGSARTPGWRPALLLPPPRMPAPMPLRAARASARWGLPACRHAPHKLTITSLNMTVEQLRHDSVPRLVHLSTPRRRGACLVLEGISEPDMLRRVLQDGMRSSFKHHCVLLTAGRPGRGAGME